MNTIIDKIIEERKQQDKKWGEQNHNDAFWYLIAGEEFGEIGKAVLENSNIKEELIQLAAVCTAWAECIERKEKKNENVNSNG